jgi:hypothetical protein
MQANIRFRQREAQMLTYARQIGIIDPEISDHDTSLSRIMLLTQFNGNNTRNLGRPGTQAARRTTMAMRAGTRGTQASASIPAVENHAYVHTLSLRLTGEQYRRLRRFVTGHEDRTGQRITHQAVLETALGEYLDRHGASTLG